MTRVIVSAKADSDFDVILDWLADKAGEEVAKRYAADLDTIYENLTMFPASGSPRPNLGTRARIAVLSPYLVIYDYLAAANIVNIVRILDGRRNITRGLVRQ